MKWYSRQGLLTLFLSCAFLPHIWTFVLAFKDFSMLTTRLNGVWGAIGVMSYGLLFAFLESILVFAITALLGLLVSPRWEESKRITLLGFLAMVPMFWEIYRQACFIWHIHFPGRLYRLIVQFPNPTGLLYGIVLIIVVVTTLVPVLLILRHEKFYSFSRAAIERITLLTGFYLFFDTVALILVIVRNV